MTRAIPRQESLIAPEIQNPFVHKINFGYLDLIQIALMSVTIAPIRLLLVGTCFLLAWPLAAIALAFRSEEDKQKPLSGWRKSLEPPLMMLAHLMMFFFGFKNVKVIGQPANSKEAQVLCVAPHSSFFDTFMFFYCSSLPSALSKAEISKVPLVSALLEFTQPVLVQREDPNSRQNTVKEIQRRARAAGQWPQIIIFPEGTCTNRSCLISYKLGAFHPGVPVQPVCLKYPNRLDTITWTWEGPGPLSLLWFTLCQFNTNIEIEFLPVYTPSEAEKADPKLFANNVRAVMAKALGVPITDHTYEDCRLMTKARLLNLPCEVGLVEFQKLHKKLGVSLEEMQNLLKKFSNIDHMNKGYITYEEFAQYLQLPGSQSLKKVFALYDRDGSGTIDFREYVIGLSLVSMPANTDSTISLAFELFDSGNQGYISQSDLYQILHNSFSMTDIDIQDLFKEVDTDKDNKITFDEFKAYAMEKPEYAPLFLAYRELSKSDDNGNNATHRPGSVKDENHLKAE